MNLTLRKSPQARWVACPGCARKNSGETALSSAFNFSFDFIPRTSGLQGPKFDGDGLLDLGRVPYQPDHNDPVQEKLSNDQTRHSAPQPEVASDRHRPCERECTGGHVSPKYRLCVLQGAQP